MTVRDRISHWLSPSLFALTALCFLLPFATVSCDSASTTFTGVQLVTRTVPRGGVLHEGPDCSTDISVCVERRSATTAAIALAAAVVGLLLALLGVVRGPGWCAAIAAGALVALPLQAGLFGPDVGMHAGWALALVSSGFAGCVHMRRAWRRYRPGREPQGPLGLHRRALGGYALIALAGVVGATASHSVLQAIGGLAIDWFVLVVLPTWLVVAVMVNRWCRQDRACVTERARRWDTFLWLGPALGLGLCSRRVRRFLLPPPASSPQRAERHVAAI